MVRITRTIDNMLDTTGLPYYHFMPTFFTDVPTCFIVYTVTAQPTMYASGVSQFTKYNINLNIIATAAEVPDTVLETLQALFQANGWICTAYSDVPMELIEPMRSMFNMMFVNIIRIEE